jgi:3-oxoacyl-[acyl-carrier protein] reductase
VVDTVLDGQVILVSGGARNLGRRIAERAAASSAAVVVNCLVDLETAQDVARSIEDRGGRAIAIRADVTDEAAVESMVVDATARLGPISSVVHCAAFRTPHRPVPEIPWDDWTRVIAVALDGAFLCAKATLPGMLEQGFGRFVFVGGATSYTGRPDGSTPGATAKAGLEGLARAIAQEFGPRGITANVVIPGALETNRTSELEAHGPWSAVRMSTIRRLVRLDEAAALCLHLCGNLGGAINGARLVVDGGLMAR